MSGKSAISDIPVTFFHRVLSVYFPILLITALLLLPAATAAASEHPAALRPSESATAGAAGQASENSPSRGSSITICMAGDILLHDPIEKACRKEDGSFDYSPVFNAAKSFISSRDLAIVNQEVILGGSALGISGYPAFNGPFDMADDLAEAGFDVVCHATNHALDKGKKGILSCISNWKTTHPEITVLGIHDSEEDAGDICIKEVKGRKIALLNYTYGTNGIKPPSDMPFLVDYLDEAGLARDLDRAEQLADFTIVLPHWGTEYSLTTDSYQKKWSRIMLEHGADLVIGTHPHVIEPVEVLSDEAGHTMTVFYSLGNFVSCTSSSGKGIANRFIGALADVTLSEDADGKLSVSDFRAVPVISHVTGMKGGVYVYPLDTYTDGLAKANIAKKKDPAFSIEYARSLCSRVFGE